MASLQKKLKSLVAQVFAPGSPAGRQARFERADREARDLYSEGQFERFQQRIAEAAEIAEEGGPTETLASQMDRLGELMEKVGMYSQALPFQERSLEVREQLYGLDDGRIAGSINNLALLHYVRGAFDEAESGFRRLTQLLEKSSPGSRELLTCVDNYAATLRKQQRDDEAAKATARAKELKAQIEARSEPASS